MTNPVPFPRASPKAANLLFILTLIVSILGIFLGLFYFFVDPATGLRIAVILMVGLVGVLSFLRHTVFYRSDQARIGWSQDHPQFQMEVGWANLAIGVLALVSGILQWGLLAYSVSFLTYGVYLFGALVTHVRDVLVDPSAGKKKMGVIINTGFFVIFLLLFGVLALVSS
jgi:ABC-type multidrug transport system permease subunit